MSTNNPKILSFDDAHRIFKSHQSIFIQGGAATPHLLIDYMMKATTGLNSLEILHLHTEGNLPYVGHPNFRVTNLFVGKNVRPFIDYESVDYIPCFLSEIGNLFRKKIKPVHVALIHVSIPDQHGHVSLGVSVDVAKAAVESADMVIAQVNRQMPRVHGDGFISLSDIDYILECDVPLAKSPKKQLTETELAIGKNVAALVEDRATLQLGIGAIPDAVCFHLKTHKDLGIHTEMWSHGGYELIKTGVVNNRFKNFHQGKTTSSFVMGDDEIYNFINDNLSVLNLEAGYTNNPINIMRNDRVTAINSATEIDLTGQVCSDSIGHKIISGVGGQMDFMRAAALSENGKPILALSSLTKKGESRIKPYLKLGAGVVTTRSHVHYVVTEMGSVNLYGKTIGERAKLLLSISHPSVREQLEREWFEFIER
jgi:4-hydroxybutyrate CoA-transferase